MPVVELPRPVSVYVLGDSHVFALSDRVYRGASGTTYLFHALYVQALLARRYVSSTGGLAGRVSAAMRGARLLVGAPFDELRAPALTDDPNSMAMAHLEDRAGVTPHLFLSVGGMDLLETMSLVDEPDMALPEFLLADPGTPAFCITATRDALPAQAALRAFAEKLEPLRSLVRRLRELGFTRLGMLGVPPATPDSRFFAESLAAVGYHVRERPDAVGFLYKSLLLVNSALRAIAAGEGVPFVDRWSPYVEGGVARPGVLRDFCHLTPEATVLTAEAIITGVIEAAPSAPVTVPKAGPLGSEAVRDRYDRSYYLADCSGHVSYALFSGRKLEDPRHVAVHALADVRRGDRVLDIGCGRGELTRAFAVADAHVTAIDYSPDAIALARQTAAGFGVRFVCADAVTFDDAAGYDVAVAADAIEHLAPDELAQLLHNVSAKLAPGGTLVLRTCPNGWAHQRPGRLRRLLRAAFPHVLVWLGSSDDPRGSLGRRFSAAEVRAVSDVYAFASHKPFDVPSVLARIATEPLDLDDTLVRISGVRHPDRVPAGQSFAVELTLDNDSDAVLSSFPPNPVRFASLWFDERGQQMGPGWRSPVSPASRPNESAGYAVQVIAPERPGRFTLRLTLVQEFVSWFRTVVDVAVETTHDGAPAASCVLGDDPYEAPRTLQASHRARGVTAREG